MSMTKHEQTDALVSKIDAVLFLLDNLGTNERRGNAAKLLNSIYDELIEIAPLDATTLYLVDQGRRFHAARHYGKQNGISHSISLKVLYRHMKA